MEPPINVVIAAGGIFNKRNGWSVIVKSLEALFPLSKGRIGALFVRDIPEQAQQTQNASPIANYRGLGHRDDALNSLDHVPLLDPSGFSGLHDLVIVFYILCGKINREEIVI